MTDDANQCMSFTVIEGRQYDCDLPASHVAEHIHNYLAHVAGKPRYTAQIRWTEDSRAKSADDVCKRCHHTRQQHEDNFGNCQCCNTGVQWAERDGMFGGCP